MNISNILQKRARTIEQAEKEKTKLKDIKSKLEKRIKDLEASIPEETGKAGEEVINNLLAGGSSNEANNKVKELKSELETKKEALNRVDELLPVAQSNIWAAQAAEKRKRAEKLRKEANEHEGRTNELLAELENHEGCQYAPKEPEKPSRPVNNLSGGALQITYREQPYSQRLFNQAKDLEKEAERLEQSAKQGKEIKNHSIIGDISKLEKVV